MSHDTCCAAPHDVQARVLAIYTATWPQAPGESVSAYYIPSTSMYVIEDYWARYVETPHGWGEAVAVFARMLTRMRICLSCASHFNGTTFDSACGLEGDPRFTRCDYCEREAECREVRPCALCRYPSPLDSPRCNHCVLCDITRRNMLCG